MKVTCESCFSGFDVDDARIPSSGAQVNCPVCGQAVRVSRDGKTASAPAPVVAAPAKRELELSSLDLDFSEPEADVPAAKSSAAPTKGKASPPPAKPPAPKPSAPVAPPPVAIPAISIAPPPLRAKPPVQPAPTTFALDDADASFDTDDAELPVAVGAELADPDEGFAPREEDFGIGLDDPDVEDLPAPVARSAEPPIPLPAPVTRRPAPAPVTPPTRVLRDSPSAPVEIDLPAARQAGAAPSHVDLPVARGPNVAELPVARGNAAELPTPAYGGPELPTAATSIDLPRARAEHDTDGVTAKRGDDNLPVAMHVELPQPLDRSSPGVAGTTATPPTGDSPSSAFPTAARLPDEATDASISPPRRRRTGLIAGALAGVIVLGGGGAVLVFTDLGKQLLGGGSADRDAVIATVRKALAEDTLIANRRAASALRQYIEQHGENLELLGMEAQAHLASARLGITAENRAADSVFEQLDKHPDDVSPEVKHARALRKLIQKKPNEARELLNAQLKDAPADATALLYLGWTELAAGEIVAAEAALTKAVATEGTRPSALYSLGRAKELRGDLTTARDLYGKTLVRSPQHFRAALGMLRTASVTGTSTPPGAVEELIQKRLDGTGPRELAEAWATAGLLALNDGRRDVAEDRLRKAVNLDPDSAVAQRELARVLLSLRRSKDALAPAQKSLELEPKSLESRLLVVGAYIDQGMTAEAQTAITSVATQKDPLVQYYLGRLLLVGERADPNKAIDLFTAAIAGNPKLLDAYLQKSSTLGKQGKVDQAVLALKEAESAASNDPTLTMELGDAYLQLGHPADAESRFRGALQKKPDEPRARLGLAVALDAQGNIDGARAELDKLLATQPKYPGLAERLGRVAMRQGKLEEANGFFDTALAESVPTTSLRLEVAELAMQLKNYDRATQLAETVAHDDDRSARAHLILAESALARGRLDDALVAARRSAVIGDLPESHFALGNILEAMGKLDQAAPEFASARRPPIENDAALGRARVMAHLGATRDALGELQPLTKIPRLRGQALILVGDCYADQEQTDKARHAFEDAVKADPASGEAAFKLGRILHDAGKREPAAVQLERATKLGGDKQKYSAEAYLLLGDTHRELHQNEPALRAYQKYLQLQPEASPSRTEAERYVRILGGGAHE